MCVLFIPVGSGCCCFLFFDVGMWVCFRCELGEQGEVICHLMFLIWFDVGLVLMFFVFCCGFGRERGQVAPA